MSKNLENLVNEKNAEFYRYLSKVCSEEKKLLVKGELLEILNKIDISKNEDYLKIEEVVNKITESVRMGLRLNFEIREQIGTSQYYQFNTENFSLQPISTVEYLKVKEQFKNPGHTNDMLTLNFQTFYEKFPSVRDSKSIGKGVEYLNRYLSSSLFNNSENLSSALFKFLFVHKYNSEQLILNDRITNPAELMTAINKAMVFLSERKERELYSKIKHKLQEFGFEPGLGRTVSQIKESLEQLDALLHTPDHLVLKQFLSRIPMVFNIAIITPHGYFGQEGVLGKPDTGGQIVYILDQVRALEQELTNSLKQSGLNIKPKIIILTRLIPNAGVTRCNEKKEKVYNTDNVWILRVPLRDNNKSVLENWISRFEIWPFLEEFANDSYIELLAEFRGRPDLIIGNYSDGNLVATILAKKFGVTQCNVAHALEKSKYLYSGLYWNELEDQYHFSTQFTADLLAMNSADFIITSTYQEIAGREDSLGQYESYRNFTMPGLYRVAGGINLFHPKFNILPPGVDTDLFFPFNEKKKRTKEITNEINTMLFSESFSSESVGQLKNPDLPPIFSMARLDKIKNLTSLVKWFGEDEELQKLSNLIIVAGKLDAGTTTDKEEKAQIDLMYRYIDEYNLRDKLRWLPGDGDRRRVPEYYRVIAERKGVFVQPALFEGFGLTVIEAMRSGLPTFATQYGGPLEIIENTKSGFHINPVESEETCKKLIKFFKDCKKDNKYWGKISSAGIERVDKAFNWQLYAKNLISLSKIYGFWKYTTNLEMSEMNAYLDLLYHMLYIPRARKMLEKPANK